MPLLLDPQPQSLQIDVNPSPCPMPALQIIPKTKWSPLWILQLGPLTQSTPVHIAQACFQFQPQYQKAQASVRQSSANGDNQTPGLGNPPQGSADEALSQEQMAAEIAQLRQQLKFTKETLEDVRDHHGSEI